MSDQLLSDKAKFELVWAELRRLGINEVCVTFNGEGDSGSIDDVAVGNTAIPGVPATGPKWAQLNASLDQARVVVHPDEPPMKLVELITELTDPLTTEQGVDWWNGDGGFGECIWHAGDDPPRIELNISERIVHTEDHGFEFDKYGEEVEDAPVPPCAE